MQDNFCTTSLHLWPEITHTAKVSDTKTRTKMLYFPSTLSTRGPWCFCDFFFSNSLHNCTSLLHCKSLLYFCSKFHRNLISVVPRPLTPRGVNENSIQKHTHFRVTSANLLLFFFSNLKRWSARPGSCVRIQRGRRSLGAVILFQAEKSGEWHSFVWQRNSNFHAAFCG